MKNLSRLFTIGTLLLPLALAGCDSTDVGDPNAEGESGTDADTEDTDADTDEADPGAADDDDDGLTNDEEAELGTDPNKKDTDGDNYWDLWELNEGTDPLSYDSRIYTGSWPYNPDKDELDPGSWSSAGQNKGDRFPRDQFLDHHGDMVDLYDFVNFTQGVSGQPAYFIFDLSAQWCGPCHNVANWMADNIDGSNQWIEDTYPTVRDKVHNLRLWWITYIVEANDGSPPTLSDATSWFEVHRDNYIPILVDADQDVIQNYSGGAFPHFFLLNPQMEIEYFPPPNASTNENPYPAVGLVDEFL